MTTTEKLREIEVILKTLLDYVWSKNFSNTNKADHFPLDLPNLALELAKAAKIEHEKIPMHAVQLISSATIRLEMFIESKAPEVPADVVDIIRTYFAKAYEAMSDLLAEWAKSQNIISENMVCRQGDFLDIAPRTDNIDPVIREQLEKMSDEITIALRDIHNADESGKEWKLENILKIRSINSMARRCIVHSDIFPIDGLDQLIELLEVAYGCGKFFQGFSPEDTERIGICLAKSQKMYSIASAAKKEKKNDVK